MTNILIVDDEILSINVILDTINWKKINIDNVYTATSMGKACKLFNDNQIDIMVCDIEMPKNSGLELLEWVKDNHYNTITIFLTGHANFNYAKKAISLQCMDYLLKPISSNKLEDIILKAIEKVNNNIREIEMKKTAEKWHANKPKILEQFWRDILTNSLPISIDNIITSSDSKNISIDRNKVYIPLLITSKKNVHNSTLNYEEWENNINLNNLFSATYQYNLSPLVFFNKKEAIVVIKINNQSTIENELLTIKLESERLIEQAKQKFKIDFTIIIGSFSFINNLSKQFQTLQTANSNNVIDEINVIFAEDIDENSSTYHQPDLNLWTEMLKQNKITSLNSSIDKYFQIQKENNNLSPIILSHFQFDYLQMIHLLLRANDISYHFIFDLEEAKKYFSESQKSVSNMKIWTKYINTKTSSYLATNNDSEDILEKIKSYIEENICEDISRNSISDKFNLNPEYLSRFFHKETGTHLIKFIQNTKIEKSKKLLVETNLNVGQIATMFGYSNFAYFSRLFKNTTSYSPNEYRKINQK